MFHLAGTLQEKNECIQAMNASSFPYISSYLPGPKDFSFLLEYSCFTMFLVSTVQQSESAICVCIYIFIYIPSFF